MRDKIIKASRDRACEWLSENYSDEALSKLGIENRYHIEDLISSVMMTRDKIMLGGSFVKAVVENDLESAIIRADDGATRALKIIVLAKMNCFVKS